MDSTSKGLKIIMVFLIFLALIGVVNAVKIYNNTIVFENDTITKNGSIDSYILMYDMKTTNKILLTMNSTSQYNPDIFGYIIAWIDGRSGDSYEVYVYNRLNASEMRIPSQVADGVFAAPSIYQDIVVWQDERNSDPNNFRPDIYMYNLTSNQETRITTDKAFAYNPVIYGDIILWEDQRNGNNTDIYMYDLKTKEETKLIAGNEDEFSPEIYGDTIIYSSGRENTDLYMYNLKTKKTTKITQNSTILGSSDIYGNIIAWDDHRKEEPGIYIYNITNNKETRISRNNTFLYGIWGNTVIWNVDVTTEEVEYNIVDMYSHNILNNETKKIVNGIIWGMR